MKLAISDCFKESSTLTPTFVKYTSALNDLQKAKSDVNTTEHKLTLINQLITYASLAIAQSNPLHESLVQESNIEKTELQLTVSLKLK